MKPKSTPCDTCSANTKSKLKRLGVNIEGYDYVVALAGNPNTGKSTVFNALTGLKQHTGNWPGKTVSRSEGGFAYEDKKYKIIDLPGTYSLISTSEDEEIARNFILFAKPDVTVIVTDATRLERNLNLVLQILEITDKAVLCVNLLDEAKRHHIEIDLRTLSRKLGIPVVGASARSQQGIPELLQAIKEVAQGKAITKPRRLSSLPQEIETNVRQLQNILEKRYANLPNSRWVAMRLLEGDEDILQALRKGDFDQMIDKLSENNESEIEKIIALSDEMRWQVGRNFHDKLSESLYAEATQITQGVVLYDQKRKHTDIDAKIDRIVTSKRWGFPIMFLILSGVLWMTIVGSNYPSQWLSTIFVDNVYSFLKEGATWLNFPWWLTGFLIDGVYLAVAWVVSVMLPPMAIFFPIFTLLEDFGYLPRIAFNLDNIFRKAGAHGKQALTMTMGFGCNAAGVVSTRIIDSPRERLIAIITNNFSLCNGRWPTQILIATVFIGSLVPSYLSGWVSMLAVIAIALLGIALMFFTSWMLSRTLLKGEVSTFHLELPPYRPPRFLQTLYTSLIDRTLVVLWRAVVFAAPAGAVIWLVANVSIGEVTIAQYAISGLDGFGWFIGLNGVILLAYIIAIPANEIVIPTILMLTVLVTGIDGYGAGSGVMFELESESQITTLLKAGGWTLLTAVNLMIFSLLHNPCSTTIYTIYKETKSVRWTIVASILPIILGFLLTFILTQLVRML
ncbi:ferrous iron transport protein B [Capnocytophaga canimorsus]|uniref:ferrous iron transport protein B n=1 Tax=Capnocytophaga canimorsus TaxID=28188 RepID=UPI0015628C91|nr:ferrous iron transport protein B [Capnocytophaga canimorsus]